MAKSCWVTLVIIFILILALIFSFYFYNKGLNPVDEGNEEIILFEIEKGWGVSDIAEALNQKGIIGSEFAFKIHVFLSGNGSKLQAGIFELSPSMTIPEVVDVLVESYEKQTELKIIEGQRMEEVARYLEEQGIRGDFIEKAKVGNFKDSYDFLADMPDSRGLEGYLFPDTYKVNINSSVDNIIEKMLDNFELKLQELPAPTNPQFNDLSDLVILASIIEREANMSNIERRRIAGVYVNRLKSSIKLQADPTVQYSKDTENYQKSSNKKDFKFWQSITQTDYETVDGGYNTYRVNGLPPGPICSPSFGSLAAAFNPEENDYYYFFHTESGNIIFSRTAEEHAANLQMY